MRIKNSLVIIFTLIFSQIGFSQKNILEIKASNIELGKIREGSKVNVFFDVYNPTKKTIKLYSVSSTCGCTIPQYPSYINSRQHVRIKAEFNSKGFLGRIRKELVLVTDDSVKYYKLTFIAQVFK